ncbi:hypothetical protein [Eubacterium limosum]|uniref:hypothetical protein n=1 Tax=Eubacterium limosum TaxID=1736 RepID=UPI0010625B69|nr:hypothetical protein [Eubacterium limosum]
MKWELIHEWSPDDVDPTCWAIEINSAEYGDYIWITEMPKGYVVEYREGDSCIEIIAFKTLPDAQEWVGHWLF